MGRFPFSGVRVAGAVLALLVSTIVFPAPAVSVGTTGWGSPELLAAADRLIDLDGNVAGYPTSPQIAMSPAGSAVAIWSSADHDRSTPWAGTVWAALFIDGRWNAPVIIGTNGLFGTGEDVAMDARGAAIAVWNQGVPSETGYAEGTLYASRFVPGEGWGLPARIGTAGGSDLAPRIAVDPEGNAFVVWFNGKFEQLAGEPAGTGKWTDSVWANHFVLGAGWGSPTLLEAERGGLANIAVDAFGNAVAGWYYERDHQPMASRYTPEGGWEAPTVLEGHSHPVKVAMDSDGTAVALWAFGPAPLRVSRHIPGTGWEAPTELVGAQDVITWPYEVAAGVEGTAIAAWSFGSTTHFNGSEKDPYYNRQVYARSFAPEVGWRVATVLSKETGSVVVRDVHSVAMDPQGDGVVVWTEHDGARTSVWASHYARGRGWGAAETISDLLPAADSWVNFYWQMSAEIAMDREGRAIAVWSQSSGNRTDVWANRFLPTSLVGTGIGAEEWVIDELGALEGSLRDANSALLALEAKVLVLTVTTVVLASGLAIVVVSYRTLRKRVRPREETASKGHSPDSPDHSNRLASKGAASHRGGAASPPGWRRWPANNAALRLTAKERILLHLLDFARHSNTTEFPPELTSTGIAMAVGIDGRHVAQYLRPLVKEGLVLEKTARVRGALQRRKVYVLDAEGWRSATGIRERVLFLTVRVRDESGDRQATVAEILAATHGHRKLLDVVREATEVGFVALSAR